MRKTAGYPLWFALAIYWLFTFGLLAASLARTNGHFGYPVDDTYIHMAIARHLAEDGFWGISAAGFSSGSSSPLWTLLLAAGYKIGGANEWLPLGLCVLIGTATIAAIHHLQRGIPPVRRLLYLVAVVALASLPMLTLIGMEHVLEALVTLALTYCAAAWLADEKAGMRGLLPVLLLAGVATATRYEGLFLIFAIAAFCMLARRFRAALAIAAAGALPISLFGLFSVLNGWYFIPNSVLLKGRAVDFTLNGPAGFILHIPSNLKAAPQVLVVLLACLLLYLARERQGSAGSRERYLTGIFVSMALLHMQLATVGWLSRYEGYIVLVGAVIAIDLLDPMLVQWLRVRDPGGAASRLALSTLAMLLVLPLVLKMGENFLGYPLAVKNIYEQQYQMGLFLRKYYSGRAVAINDVGAVNYLGDVRTLDLAGIASMEVARATVDGSFGEDTIRELAAAQDVEVAILYAAWYAGEIPADWVEVGEWTISSNVICSDDVVTIYAPGSRWQNDLTANLRAFSGLLPPTVRQSGPYTVP